MLHSSGSGSAKLRVDAAWESWRLGGSVGTPGLAYDMPTPDFSADIMVGTGYFLKGG